MNETDEQLLSRHLEGDKGALTELLRRHQRPIYFFVRRRVNSDEDARDISQRVFMRAFQAMDQFEGRARFGTWLHQIAANLCINHYRDSGRAQFVEAKPDDVQEESVVQRALEDHENSALLAHSIKMLPTRQREVLTLRVYQDLSFAEIGEQVGISQGNARVSYHMAVKSLRAILNPVAQEAQA